MDSTPESRKPLGSFFILWTGQALSLIGSQAVQFALIWWVTSVSGSAAVLSLATFLALLPQIVLGPLCGALVDRWSRKVVMLVADAAVAAASLLLALIFLTGTATVTHVLALLFIRAVGAAFHAPAMIASTTLMVPENHLTRIQGLNQSLQGGQLVVSAPLGAVLFNSFSMAGVMLVDVATALFAIVPLLFIHVPQPRRGEATETGGSTWRDVMAGLSYLRARRGHATLLAMAALINVCMVPAFTLLPLLVAERLGGAMHLGALSSLFGVGTIVGGILLGIWGGFRVRIHTTLVAMLGAGLATLALGTASGLSTALVAITALGIMVALVNGPIHAVLQATVAPEFQGRVFSLYGSLAALVTPVGLAIAAPVADLFGITVWFVAGGLACLLMGGIGFSSQALVQIERGAAAEKRRGDEDGTLAERVEA